MAAPLQPGMTIQLRTSLRGASQLPALPLEIEGSFEPASSPAPQSSVRARCPQRAQSSPKATRASAVAKIAQSANAFMPRVRVCVEDPNRDTGTWQSSSIDCYGLFLRPSFRIGAGYARRGCP